MASRPNQDVDGKDGYDLVTVCGCFVPGHLPCDSVIEMMRLTKAGGIVCIVNRKSVFYESTEYVGNFFPLLDRLEQEGKIQMAEMSDFRGFLNDVEGLTIVLRVN